MSNPSANQGMNVQDTEDWESMAKQLKAETEQHPRDGFLFYMFVVKCLIIALLGHYINSYSLVLKKLKLYKLATDASVQSVICYPFNWSAWMGLSSQIITQDQVNWWLF